MEKLYFVGAAILIFVGFYVTAVSPWAQRYTYVLALCIGVGVGLIMYGILEIKGKRAK